MSDKLVKTIKKLIEIEVKKQVKATLNEVLANKFLETISESKSQKSKSAFNLKTSSFSDDDNDEPIVSFAPDKRKERVMIEERKRLDELKQKISANTALPIDIFEDISIEEVNQVGRQGSAEDVEPDVDLEDIQALMQGRK